MKIMAQKLVSNNQNNILPTSSVFYSQFPNIFTSFFYTTHSNGWEAPWFLTFAEDKWKTADKEQKTIPSIYGK